MQKYREELLLAGLAVLVAIAASLLADPPPEAQTQFPAYSTVQEQP